MADKPASSNRSPADERRDRLAQNLRANLRRRKQQSRERRSSDAPMAQAPASSPDLRPKKE